MKPYSFSKEQARTMLLLAQGFGEWGFGDSGGALGRDEVEACIRQMGVLQIDTIHVVARSPYLVLWSRLGSYDPQLLDQLLEDGRLFEYWSHEACFIPIKLYSLFRRLMIEKRHKPRVLQWMETNRTAAEGMLEHVRTQGEVRSADFDRTDGKKGGWWEWKAEKIALEVLHTSGDLMIARRERFHRIYDVRERVLERALPRWDDGHAPSYDEVIRRLVLKSVECLGVACEGWCADYFRLPKKEVAKALEFLAVDGHLFEAEIEGLTDRAFVASEQLAKSVLGGVQFLGVSLLSPFDPVVWDRVRALELFDFDYRIECYMPEAKRRYGYFSLPILVGSAIVGRLDAKAHRKDKVFEVKNLVLEPGVKPDAALVASIARTLKQCAIWHGTPQVTVTKANTVRLASSIESAAKRVRFRKDDVR